MFWHAAFNRTCSHSNILHKYWDKWIALKGKTVFIGKTEFSKKTAFSVLAMRESGEVARRKKKAACRQVREFKYESDDDGSGNICAGNWGATRMTSTTIRSRSGRDGQDNNERAGKDNELDEQSSESERNGEEYDHESSSSEDETTNINENGKRSLHYMRRGV